MAEFPGHSDSGIPLPPVAFMDLVCGPGKADAFESVGQAVAGMVEEANMVAPRTRFLDVGCGCGRVARYLMRAPLESYVGFDRNAGMIRWCQREISSRAQHFVFQFFDLTSAYHIVDDHAGSLLPECFRFPYADEEYDSVLLSSVFTHMPMTEIGQYLIEIHRVLKDRGKVLLSVFFTESEPYVEFINFFHRRVDFEELLTTAGFRYHLEQEPNFGIRHNWYVLSKDNSAGALCGWLPSTSAH